MSISLVPIFLVFSASSIPFIARFLTRIHPSDVVYHPTATLDWNTDEPTFLPATGRNMPSSTRTSRTREILFRRTTKPTRSSCCVGIQDRNPPSTTIPATVAGSKFSKEKLERFDTMRNYIQSRRSTAERTKYRTSPIISGTTRLEIRPKHRLWRFTCTLHPSRAAGVGAANEPIPRNPGMGNPWTTPSTEFSR